MLKEVANRLKPTSKFVATEPKPFSFATDNREKLRTTVAAETGLPKSVLRRHSGIKKKTAEVQAKKVAKKTNKETEEKEKESNVPFKALPLDESILRGPVQLIFSYLFLLCFSQREFQQCTHTSLPHLLAHYF